MNSPYASLLFGACSRCGAATKLPAFAVGDFEPIQMCSCAVTPGPSALTPRTRGRQRQAQMYDKAVVKLQATLSCHDFSELAMRVGILAGEVQAAVLDGDPVEVMERLVYLAATTRALATETEELEGTAVVVEER